MRVIVGGKFEAALIHELDEANNPGRNRTTHPYYLGLNRKTDKRYFERLATFLAIAEEIAVPTADWSDSASGNGVSGGTIGLLAHTGSLNEWDGAAVDFSKQVIESGVLSDDAISYISFLDLSSHSEVDRNDLNRKLDEIQSEVALHYLCRLILQIREAGKQNALLVLDEEDIRIISEIGDGVRNDLIHPPFAFPDLSERIILGSDFAGGLFNFSPRDMRSVVAIRADPEVQKYAAMVRNTFGASASLQTERDLLNAMRKSYSSVVARQKVDRVFEVAGWVAKPLHYVPGVDAALSIAEDIKDVGQLIIDRNKDTKQWYLLAARATQVNIEDYLSRKENL